MLVGGSNIDSRSIPFVTILLIVVSVCVFIKCYSLEIGAAREYQENFVVFVTGTADSTSFQKQDEYDVFVEDWGFSLPDLTERKDFISMFTYMFIHAGLFHIVGNMVMLWAFGVALEEALGSAVFLLFFLVCGIAAAFGQAFMDMSSDIPTVGASGAIAGVMGAFFVIFGAKAKLKMMLFIGFMPLFIELPALVFGLIWTCQQVFALSQSGGEGGGVAWMCHIAGLITGGTLGMMLKGDLKGDIISNSDGSMKIAKKTSSKLTEHEILEQVLECQPVDVVVDHLLGSDAEVNCTQCKLPLDMTKPMGARMVRCDSCGKVVYVDAELLMANRDIATMNF